MTTTKVLAGYQEIFPQQVSVEGLHIGFLGLFSIGHKLLLDVQVCGMDLMNVSPPPFPPSCPTGDP